MGVNNMARIIHVALTFCSFILSGTTTDIESCLELFKPENFDKMCCEKMELLGDDTGECEDKNGKIWTCEQSKCILRKYDLLNGEEIDEIKANKFLNELLKDDPNNEPTVERVRGECFNGKYEQVQIETCSAFKFQTCVNAYSLIECPSWKSDAFCAKMADHAEECKIALDHNSKLFSS